MTTLANRRRPMTFDDVSGNDTQIRVLCGLLSLPTSPEDKRPRVYVHTGAPGSGKTTIARIAASQLVTDPATDILEINGGDENKVDDFRELCDRVQFLPFSGGARAIIVDEAHRLTPDAWSMLLKPLEDGHPHNYWFICTSEDKKIPVAIRRRAKCIEIQKVSDRDMGRILIRTAKGEGLQLPEAIRARIVELANGSTGEALSHLETVSPLCSGTGPMGEEEIQEALRFLKAPGDGAKNLGKALLDGAKLEDIIQILKNCQDAKEDPESLRRGVLGYASAALLNGWDKNARAVGILQVFSAGTTYDSGFPCLVAMAMTAGNM